MEGCIPEGGYDLFELLRTVIIFVDQIALEGFFTAQRELNRKELVMQTQFIDESPHFA